MSKQKTLIAIIAAVVLICIAAAFILFNNQNRDTNSKGNSSSSMSTSASNSMSSSMATSVPPDPMGDNNPTSVTPPNLNNIPTPNGASDPLNSAARQSVPATASAPTSAGLITSTPAANLNDSGIVTSTPANTTTSANVNSLTNGQPGAPVAPR